MIFLAEQIDESYHPGPMAHPDEIMQYMFFLEIKKRTENMKEAASGMVKAFNKAFSPPIDPIALPTLDHVGSRSDSPVESRNTTQPKKPKKTENQ